jgi:hypothetical protein
MVILIQRLLYYTLKEQGDYHAESDEISRVSYRLAQDAKYNGQQCAVAEMAAMNIKEGMPVKLLIGLFSDGIVHITHKVEKEKRGIS